MKKLNLFYDKISNERVQLKIFYILIGATFIGMFLLNYDFPLFADDWVYSYIFKEPHKRIHTISDIIRSQYTHYFTWGGRTVVHFIAQFQILIGKGWNDILNSLAFIALIFYMYLFSNRDRKYNAFLFFLLATGTWFAQPAFGATLLWKTGSANYLWGTLIILAFCYKYFCAFTDQQKHKNSIYYIIWLSILGIIAGWTNENMAIALLFFISSIIIFFKWKKKTIEKWMISGLLGTIIGTVILICAPGNFIRATEHFENSDQTITFSEEIINRIDRMWEHYLHYSLALSIIFILLLIYVNKNAINKYNNKILGAILCMLTAHIAFLVMIVSPQFPPRAMFGVITFQLISIGILYSQINFSNTVVRLLHIGGIAIIAGLFSIDYYWRKDVLDDIASKWHVREKYIEEQKKIGNTDITFPNIMVYPEKYYMYDVSTEATNWKNEACAIYYGVDSIRVIPKLVFDAEYNNQK